MLIKKGDKFGKLTAIRFIKRDRNYHYFWEMKCDCGNKSIVRRSDLKKTKSCGCMVGINLKTHGLGHTRINNIWSGILTRVRNGNTIYTRYYKAKGISISKSWLKFENFYKDMGESYKIHCKKYGIKNTSIDRIDSNKGYSKINCKWSTPIEQNRNKSNNIKYNGETATEASYRLTNGHNPWLIFSRIKNGWKLKDAFTIPKVR
ncbi:MAG: hypothetical protein ACP5N7_05910 [Candidatus Pacearchaeota archaeon]